ncbi:hypothetical protein [Yersinia rohdei]|nr:hypothetical protein [Yersinia rohdei]
MEFISHGTFMTLTTKRDEIEKQLTRWQGWFLSAGLLAAFSRPNH